MRLSITLKVGFGLSITMRVEHGAVSHLWGEAWGCVTWRWGTGLSLTAYSHPRQVAVLGRSLAEERGRSLAAGGALRALEIAVGGAQARVGGACRARDRACERLRQQQVGGARAGAGPERGRSLWQGQCQGKGCG